MKKLLYLSLLIISTQIFISCVTVNATYTPPNEMNNPDKFSRIINKPFNEVWDNLISYSGTTFFGIENFEKASGLLTLSFGASNPEKYITGGHWSFHASQGVNSLDFDGDYVEYCVQYLKGTSLSGKMNIVVRALTDSTTSVRINARYVFTTDVLNSRQTWSFNSGECSNQKVFNKVKGTPDFRKICPTYLAEETILKALE